MRNTSPRPTIEQRDNNELIEDLCISLRDVGCCWFPDVDDKAKKPIEAVQTIHSELQRRGVDVKARVRRLTEETSWLMEELLDDCLNYPKVIPYVRDKDGIKRSLRCEICRQGETPDRVGVGMCDRCVTAAIESLQNRVPITGLVLFRTYNESKRCKHADSDTVLMTFDDEYDFGMGNSYCMQCLIDEKQRRVNL